MKKNDEFDMEAITETHRVWHKFSKWVTKTFGSDLYGEWKYIEPTAPSKKRMRYRSFDEKKMNSRLVGHKAIQKVRKYVNRCCKEIRIVECDDSTHSGSIMLLIPHPKFGITVINMPQHGSQNQFFLYRCDYEMLIRELRAMKHVYKGAF